ncbi:MAG: class I SAM-dependent methyltransferase [Kiloniellales bacterium]|nr:class I SAM-dependent methyltransferase [Kiloniellales bacterium]
MMLARWGRGARRRAWYGLLTALGLAERGFFIPYRYAGQRLPAGRRPAYAAAERMFEACQPQFAAVLGWIDGFGEALLRIGDEAAPAPRWAQDWYPRLDAAVAYSLVRRQRPARIVEVGSGHSTRFLLRARDDGALATEITAIDPAPRAWLDAAQPRGFTLLRQTLQSAGSAPFAALAPGDLLMIDSSHVTMPGSDVDLLLGHVIPALPNGVFVAFHDIFLPDDYPADWAWRGYNEQLAVLALILGGAWEVVFASHYVTTRMPGAVAESVASALPLPLGAHESALWLCKTGPGAGAHDEMTDLDPGRT